MDNIRSYLTFKVGIESFAIDVSNIEAIIEYSHLTEVPELPTCILGVLNLRGEVLPVFDSGLKLGFSKIEVKKNTCIVVLELVLDEQDVKVGLLVDEVTEVIEIDDEDIRPSPSVGTRIKSDVISGIFSQENSITLILNVEKVIGSSEIINLDVA